MEPGKELKQTVPYLPLCPHLHPSGAARRAEQKGEGFVCSASAPISGHPASQKVLLCPRSSAPARPTLGTGTRPLGAHLGRPNRVSPSCTPLSHHTAALCIPLFSPLPLPSPVSSFLYRTPHSFILFCSPLIPLPTSSRLPLPLFILHPGISPALFSVLLPCRPSPSPPPPPSPAGVSVRVAHRLRAPVPRYRLPSRFWWGLRWGETHGRGVEGLSLPRPPPAPSHARKMMGKSGKKDRSLR